MEETRIVKNCSECPLMKNSMDGLYCNHPMWSLKANALGNSIYDSHIIEKESIPEKCPLRDSDYVRIIKLV